MTTDYRKPIPLRIAQATLDEVAAAAKARGKSNQEIMRLALDAGLALLNRRNFKLGDANVLAEDAGQPDGADHGGISRMAEGVVERTSVPALPW